MYATVRLQNKNREGLYEEKNNGFRLDCEITCAVGTLSIARLSYNYKGMRLIHVVNKDRKRKEGLERVN
jgi:hypothetical protein